MLSTLALRSGSFAGSIRTALKVKQAQQIATRLLSTSAVRHADAETYLYKKPEVIHVPKTQEEISMERAKKLRNWESANEIFYGPERDLKNFPHPKMAVESPKNHLGFIPTNWFKALYPKTGVTGPYVLTWGFAMLCMAKEWVVIEHMFVEVPCLILLLVYTNYKFGPRIAEFLDKKSEEQRFETYEKPKADAKVEYNSNIEKAKEEVWRQEAVPIIFQAKKENIALQLETQYRQRLHQVFGEVKKRLDYQAEVEAANKRFEQKHMVKWIVRNVLQSITPQQEKESIANCIQTLKSLSATAKA